MAWLSDENFCWFKELRNICWHGLKPQVLLSPDCNIQNVSKELKCKNVTSFSLVIGVGILKEVFNSRERNIFYCLKLCTVCLKFGNYPFISCMIWVWDPCSSEYDISAERLWLYLLFLVSLSQHWLLFSLKSVLYISQGRWKCNFDISILLVLWSTCHLTIILNVSLQHVHLTYGKTLTCRAVCNACAYMT